MYRAAQYLLIPLLFANITIGANPWQALGVNLGQALFWVIIALSWFVTLRTPYRFVSTAALALGLLLRWSEFLSSSMLIHALRYGALGLVFVLAGATLYGRNPHLIHKQLVIFLALCIPVMLLQMSGASSFFMSWDTEYADIPSLLELSEIGTFKTIPVYPTLFVSGEDFYYQVGQGRPVGLLYSNNVLSVFVAIAFGLNFALAPSSRLRVSDVVVSVALVLTMALTSYFSALLILAAFLVFGVSWRRRLVIKLVFLLVMLEATYYLLFPGLFLNNFSEPRMLTGLLARGVVLSDMVGLDSLRHLYEQNTTYLGEFMKDSPYSGIAKILKSPIGGALVIMAPPFIVFYYRRLKVVRRIIDTPHLAYSVTAIACALSQLGVPYYEAPSFQIILGFALFPLFRQLWPIAYVSDHGVSICGGSSSVRLSGRSGRVRGVFRRVRS